MKFTKAFQNVLAALGLTDKAKKKELTAEDWKNIAQSYKQETGRDFYADAEGAGDEDKAAKAAAHDRTLELLAAEDDKEDEEEDEETEEEEEKEEKTSGKKSKKSKKAKASLVERATAMSNQNKALQQQVATMARQPENDNPAIVRSSMPVGLSMPHTAAHLFGIQHPMFDAKKRWNQITMRGRKAALESDPDDETFDAFKAEFRSFGKSLSARMQDLQAQGLLSVIALTDGSVDYSGLSEAGLGEQFLVRRQDALIARILGLPDVFGIFPLRSNVQDGELITNAFFGEFSQAYQEGEQSKGGMELQPEKAKVHDVMFKTLFRSMKWIETQYIGYLNTNGSDPVKWTMIEWMILNIATVLRNEQNSRYILGCRVEPKKGENSHYLNGSTGIIYRLLSYVEDFKLLPFTESAYADYNNTTICDVIEQFAGAVHDILPNLLNKAIYLNEKHKPMYLACYRKKYGKDMDFTGPVMKLMNYDLPIQWVPNMGNLKFMWISDMGNLQTMENLPGEMFNTKFEQRLESVWGYAVWKEGTCAAFAGHPFKSFAELMANKRQDQAIFMNYPATTLAANDETIDASKNILFVTGVNTADKKITDIANAQPGMVIKLEIGSDQKPQSIDKDGKFSELTAAWKPSEVGAWIKLLLDSKTGKFIEVARS